MSGWAAKRFWTAARVEPVPGGFGVALDARAVTTPARARLVVPTEALARAIAAEWDAQTGRVDPRTMPFTRAANAAVDKVAVAFDEVAAMVAAYGGSDLLCYRAEGPPALVARQAAGWDPLIAWAGAALGAPLRVTAGVMPVEQPGASLAALGARVAAMGAFRLTGFHDLVAISGSLVLGFAVAEGRLDAGAAWALSRIDERWQADLWGRDDEAEALEAVRHAAFVQAERFYRLS